MAKKGRKTKEKRQLKRKSLRRRQLITDQWNKKDPDDVRTGLFEHTCSERTFLSLHVLTYPKSKPDMIAKGYVPKTSTSKLWSFSEPKRSWPFGPFGSTFYTVVFVIPIFTRRATNGADRCTDGAGPRNWGGKVTQVGPQGKKFKVGDLAAVGCLVDSCRECENCRQGLEQYCYNGATEHITPATKFMAGLPMADIQIRW